MIMIYILELENNFEVSRSRENLFLDFAFQNFILKLADKFFVDKIVLIRTEIENSSMDIENRILGRSLSVNHSIRNIILQSKRSNLNLQHPFST